MLFLNFYDDRNLPLAQFLQAHEGENFVRSNTSQLRRGDTAGIKPEKGFVDALPGKKLNKEAIFSPAKKSNFKRCLPTCRCDAIKC